MGSFVTLGHKGIQTEGFEDVVRQGFARESFLDKGQDQT